MPLELIKLRIETNHYSILCVLEKVHILQSLNEMLRNQNHMVNGAVPIFYSFANYIQKGLLTVFIRKDC